MPHVTFTQNWTWHLNARYAKAFPAGYSGLITTDQYNQAKAAGVLENDFIQGARKNTRKAEGGTGEREAGDAQATGERSASVDAAHEISGE